MAAHHPNNEFLKQFFSASELKYMHLRSPCDPAYLTNTIILKHVSQVAFAAVSEDSAASRYTFIGPRSMTANGQLHCQLHAEISVMGKRSVTAVPPSAFYLTILDAIVAKHCHHEEFTITKHRTIDPLNVDGHTFFVSANNANVSDAEIHNILNTLWSEMVFAVQAQVYPHRLIIMH